MLSSRVKEASDASILGRCFRDVLLEDSHGVDVDITNDIKTYLRASKMGEMGNSTMSSAACELHKRLMESMGMCHDSVEERELFTRFLSYVSKLFRTSCQVNIKVGVEYAVADIYINGEYVTCFDCEHESAYHDGIVFSTSSGVVHGSVDCRPGSVNGSSGMFTSSAHLTDDVIKEIRAMGLVPALASRGSYHENFIYAVGILPSYANKLSERDGIYYDCKM